MTINDFYVRHNDGCKAVGVEPIPFDQAETLAVTLLQRLCTDVAKDDRHAYLEKDYSVTLTAGVALLTSHTDMLHEFIRRVVYALGTDEQMVVSMLPDGATRNDLLHERNTFYLYAVRQAKTLYVQTGDVDDPEDGTLTVTASYVSTLADLPLVLEDDFIIMSVAARRNALAA